MRSPGAGSSWPWLAASSWDPWSSATWYRSASLCADHGWSTCRSGWMGRRHRTTNLEIKQTQRKTGLRLGMHTSWRTTIALLYFTIFYYCSLIPNLLGLFFLVESGSWMLKDKNWPNMSCWVKMLRKSLCPWLKIFHRPSSGLWQWFSTDGVSLLSTQCVPVTGFSGGEVPVEEHIRYLCLFKAWHVRQL